MSRLFGLQIEPSAQSAFQHDYWEEFSKVNDIFTHEPDLEVVQVSSNRSSSGNKPKSKDKPPDNGSGSESRADRVKKYIKDKADSAKGLVWKKNGSANSRKTDVSETELAERANKSPERPIDLHMYPELPEEYGLSNGSNRTREIDTPSSSPGKGKENKTKNGSSSSKEERERFISVAVQTDMSYMRDVEEVLPYSCCFCCRSTTPCIVWAFIAISLIFFKMGAIVTGRWIYLSHTSFDEIVFYIAFTICLAFATFYFRHGTKYHNPFDMLFLVLTVPIMWGLLAFTTFFLKRDMFFYVGSVIYTVFILPYIGMGIYIAYRFWATGKLFLRRVEGDRPLEPLCRKLFFATSLMIFDGQLSICSSIISMSSTVNHDSTRVWLSSVIFGPISIVVTIVWMIIGYFAMRKESKLLTWIFTLLSINQFILTVGMLLKRPRAPGGEFMFVSVAMVFSTTIVLSVHICLLVVLWNWIVPLYGKGLKKPLRRTSQNNCIQCTQLTICR